MKVDIGDYPKGKRKRKEKVEVQKHDTYSLCDTLALVILPCLEEFKKHKDSYPMDMSEKEWDEIIDKMIFSFTEIKNDMSDYENYEKVQEGLDLFAKWYRGLWW